MEGKAIPYINLNISTKMEFRLNKKEGLELVAYKFYWHDSSGNHPLLGYYLKEEVI